MAIVDKSYFLHERDEKGNLKPVVVEIEKGMEVEVIPLTFADMVEMSRNPDKQFDIISKCLVSPKMTPDEIRNGKSNFLSILIGKLTEVSTGPSFREK